jgi:hypothetical protein
MEPARGPWSTAPSTTPAVELAGEFKQPSPLRFGQWRQGMPYHAAGDDAAFPHDCLGCQFCLHGAAPSEGWPAQRPHLAGWGQAPVCPAGPKPVYLAVSPFRGGIASAPWWRSAEPVAAEQLGRRACSRLFVEIDVGPTPRLCTPGFSNAAFSDAPPCQIVLRASPVGLTTQSTGSYLLGF